MSLDSRYHPRNERANAKFYSLESLLHNNQIGNLPISKKRDYRGLITVEVLLEIWHKFSLISVI